MSAELFAAAASVAFAASAVIIKKGLLRQPSPFSAFIAFATASLLLWAIVLFREIALPASSGTALFAIRGLIDPGVVPFLIFVAFKRIGVAVTVPIIAASALISTLLSVTFLGESVTLFMATGTISIVGGVAFLAFKRPHSNIKARHILIAVLGSSLIGVTAVLTKIALNHSNSPVSGVAVSFSAGLLLQAAIITALGKWKELSLSLEKTRPFAAAGLLIGIGFVLWYFATSIGMVSVVQPIISAQALFALLFSAAFLRKQEAITMNIVLGTVMIVSGIILLSFV